MASSLVSVVLALLFFIFRDSGQFGVQVEGCGHKSRANGNCIDVGEYVIRNTQLGSQLNRLCELIYSWTLRGTSHVPPMCYHEKTR